MQPSTKNILVDLIISNHETHGRPAVSDEDRPELVRHLTHVLVNPATLRRHVDALKSVNFPGLEKISANTAKLALGDGLEKLTPNQLAALALNPKALRHLRSKIGNEVPEVWRKALEDEGVGNPTQVAYEE